MWFYTRNKKDSRKKDMEVSTLDSIREGYAGKATPK